MVMFWKLHSVRERLLEKVLRLVWNQFSLRAQEKLQMGSGVWLCGQGRRPKGPLKQPAEMSRVAICFW